ncbi:Mitochondrial intermembrane space import and assembly protein 40-B [Holothuria leucospilota]|uniref:Mitochondrial intermembrane space import and assembly protein 40-B n=1 Tax=Holothuria leucospilota TaxID=206669 RepID=A0A9Q1HIA3_HOLLE|nr:Mitochondrial intermembrane space import and assembly protein 40-B [Holothuria leucospilota]
MSYCREEGKDKVIFVTQEDHESPVKEEIISILDDDPDDEAEGLILPSGEINWNCPCLGGMASGPCGAEFREAFSCFHYSQAEPKGSDCIEKFRDMQMCMSDYPEVYPPKEEDGDEDVEKREDEVKDDDRIEGGAEGSNENNKTEDAKQKTLTDSTGEAGTTS